MKKLLLTASVLTAAWSASYAQLSRGSFMVGGNLVSSGFTFQKNNTSFDFNLVPKAGYFVTNNLAVGASVDVGINLDEFTNTYSYGVTPFARYFVTRNQVADMPRLVTPYAEAGIGFGGRNSKTKMTDGSTVTVTSNGPRAYVQPGLNWFLSRNVALDLGLRYQFTGASPSVSELGLALGFQVFLTPRDAKRTYDETKTDVERMQRNMEKRKD